MSRGQRVLVAMSGGVDSSMAAAILKEEGYEVIGATMKIWPREHCGKQGKKPCCSLRDIEDAKKVCDVLGIRHYVLNFEKVFREKVIDYFISEYLKGRTPNPCILCNEKIKFGTFLRRAGELDCDFISTGHHARIERNGCCRLRESVDKRKDQSYVLFSLSPAQIEKTLFPIGDSNKDDIRGNAEALGLSVSKKSDSQEICFVPDNDYPGFIMRHRALDFKKGDIIDSNGRVLGQHNGYWNFTIGQRRGLGISHKGPLYVTAIDADKDIIRVGEYAELKKKRFRVKGINWFDKKGVGKERKAEVKIRYNHKKSEAFLKKVNEGEIEVEFEEPQAAITPGQAAVFYEGEYVLGGGWIERVLV